MERETAGVAFDFDIQIVSSIVDSEFWELEAGQFDFLSDGQVLAFEAEYVVSDGIDQVVNTVTVTITGENDLPVTAPDQYTLTEDIPLEVGAAEGVLVKGAAKLQGGLEAQLVEALGDNLLALLWDLAAKDEVF